MDLIHELRLIQNWISENTQLCECSVDLKFDGNEIKINIAVRCGWDWLTDVTKNFNACDWETNKKGADEFVRNFEYKQYANVTLENWQTYKSE